MARARDRRTGGGGDGYRRDTFALPREAARAKARELFDRFPKAAYMTEIEHWRVLPGDRIEFTMRRLRSADALLRRPRGKPDDGFKRETFALAREAARAQARAMFRRYPKAAYMTEIEHWRELPDGRIEFTMRRLPSAD